MKPVRVAVGSLRGPKLQAVRAALETCGKWLSPAGTEFEVRGFDVPSGVRATPLSRLESMQGARFRANALRQIAHERNETWEYCVGLEGGLEVMLVDGERRVFLESWAYICGRDAAGHYGQSGAIALPDEIATEVVDRGVELSDAIDAFAGTQGIRDGLGAWGVLTCGVITREEAFRIAAINAFAPFFTRTRQAAKA
jgi:non-canonical (house-cleaning) NTP pyrophosphatase